MPSPDAGAGALADLLFPGEAAAKTPSDYEALYPPRELRAGAMVTRYAPSPTGYMHVGGVYVALICELLARRTDGVFYLRIEDTDTKRAIEGAVETILDALAAYGLTPQEGPLRTGDGRVEERGAYGPYFQTRRASIYRAYAIWLLQRNLAYPCFATAEEVDEIRAKQVKLDVKPGIHGAWAPWRSAPIARVEERLAQGGEFVVRLRAPDDASGRVQWTDAVKGVISMPVNDLDVVLLKSDGIPTYHFAHAVDDHLMRTTHVIRGDEWVSSMPIHIQLFEMLGFPLCTYAHVPPIQKIEHAEEIDERTGERRAYDSRRKLSKRKDPEANVDFYVEHGVPVSATKDYLMNIANSSFEDWRKSHPGSALRDFPLRLDKLAAGGALSDMAKLESISKDVISRLDAARAYAEGLAWAKRFDPELASLMERDPDYSKRALGIERDSPKGNKRIVTWRRLRDQLGYFFDEVYDALPAFDFPPEMPVEERSALISELLRAYDPDDSCETWLEKVRRVAVDAGYAPEVKQYKSSPTAFKGHIGDVAMVYRVAVSGVRQTPDLCQVLKVMGPARVRARLARFVQPPSERGDPSLGRAAPAGGRSASRT